MRAHFCTHEAGGEGLGQPCVQTQALILTSTVTSKPPLPHLQNARTSLEKEMATHSSILAWEIPCTEEPGQLQSTGSQRVRLPSC